MLKKIILFIVLIINIKAIQAQQTLQQSGGFSGGGINGNRNFNNRNNTDTGFKKRNDAADSITIYYKYINQFKINFLDSNINNFDKQNIAPYYYQNLGNTATATRSLIFNPYLQSGFNTGLNQYNPYNYTFENTKLYTTTKPFTELIYLLSSSAEQMINVTHTQNKKDNLNFSLEYRFINAPGLYKNQNASLNNTRFVLQYNSPNKRYHLILAYIANKNASSENGGLVNPLQLDSLQLGNPFELTTRLGPNNAIRRNPFSTAIFTGNIHKTSQVTLQQQYDIGQKDSVEINGKFSRIFYPRLRLQHTLSVKKNSYEFIDLYADSTRYKNYFNIQLQKAGADTFKLSDTWNILQNELSIISYPDKKNASQFLKVGAMLENYKGVFNNNNSTFFNFSILGEYRNRTKNKIWDIDAQAQLHLSGYNQGDYKLKASLTKLIQNKKAEIELGFINLQKTPDFIFNSLSSFNRNANNNFNKENTIKFWFNYNNPNKKIILNANLFAINNYLYFDSFFAPKQEARLINILNINFEKQFHLAKKINWYVGVNMQNATANIPINIPTIIAYNRFVFEGTFYKNLNLATGLEVRYINNYKPNGYSPFNGQFYFQNSFSLTNLPDVHLFFNFRIKSFKTYFRIENLNTLIQSGSKQYNYSLQNYAMQGMWVRFGVWWNFVN